MKAKSLEVRSERIRRRKVDPLATNKIDYVDYKEVNQLRKFISENGKILPARITGLSRKNQRMVARAIKRARQIGFLPLSGSTIP